MKKTILLFTALFSLIQLRAQLMVILQAPPTGFTYKPQLWNMVMTNTSSTPMSLHIEVTLNEQGSSQQVLSGTTRVFTLPVGTTVMNVTQFMPIQYNISPANTMVDANPQGLLPIGNFDACYHFIQHYSDNASEIAEQCEEIRVEPLSPPQLIFPYDQSAIEETRPQLSWLPPIPAQMFSQLQYDLTLVELSPNQSAADAIQQNMPLYQGVNLSTNMIQYPLASPALEIGKQYAWRVIARSNNAYVGSSETWQFALRQFGKLTQTPGTVAPYVQLRKDPETAYAIFIDKLKFSYLNETADTIWQTRVVDLSDAAKSKQLNFDTLSLKLGINLVEFDAASENFFIDKHVYQIEVLNSRNERWRLRFEFRRSEQTNN